MADAATDVGVAVDIEGMEIISPVHAIPQQEQHQIKKSDGTMERDSSAVYTDEDAEKNEYRGFLCWDIRVFEIINLKGDRKKLSIVGTQFPVI